MTTVPINIVEAATEHNLSEADTIGSVYGQGAFANRAGSTKDKDTRSFSITRLPSSIYRDDSRYLEEWVDQALDCLSPSVRAAFTQTAEQADSPRQEVEQDNADEDTSEWSILRNITISEDQTAASDVARRRLLAALDLNSTENEPDISAEQSPSSKTLHKSSYHPVLRHSSRQGPLRPTMASISMRLKRDPTAESPSRTAAGGRDSKDFQAVDQHFPDTAEIQLESKYEGEADQRIEQLQREIERLRKDSNEQSTRPPKYEVFNILPGSQTVYLAEPTWEKTGKELFLKGNLPIVQPEIHLERQGNIAFVVERIFTWKTTTDALEVANDGRTPIPAPTPRYHFIQLRSQPMKDAAKFFFQELKKLNEELPDPDLDKGLHSPFLFWYHYRSSGVLDRLPSEHQHLMKLLTNWIDQEYGSEYAEADDLFRQGLVTESTFDYLMRPGELIVSTTKTSKGKSRAYVNTSWPWMTFDAVNGDGDSDDSSDYGASQDPSVSQWSVDGWTYSYDGQFWKETVQLHISIKFNKPKEQVRIDSLKLFPVRFANKLREELEQRGKTFWSCRKRRFVSYPSKGDNGVLVSHGERYMVDFLTYRKLHSDSPGFKQTYNNAQAHDYMREDIMEKDEPPAPHVTLFPPTIAGFNLRQKKWLDLEVDKIQDVQWNKDAFNRLVVDDEMKELIQALITNRIATERSTDWINAKGNGLIMLLHGGPGTGKTFTAESVAELAEKPLYPVTCGDIGTRPEEVEQYLDSVLTLGRLWDCVVLLDEADVFLEQRTLNDLRRNALVSVFLRVLEYYDGILILTSNRVGIFDEAFKSRIQLALHYENLQKPQRVKIWKNFLTRLQSLGEEDIDYDTIDSYIDELSDYEMNGRQIRNAITTARQLAKFKGKPMGFGHLRHVIKVAGKFDHYLLQVHDKISDDQIARGEGFR